MNPLAPFFASLSRARSLARLKLGVMDGAGAALGADHIGLYLLEPGSGRPSEIHVRHLPESFVVGYEQLGRDEDRVLARVVATRRASFDEEAFPGESWKRSLLYRSFARRYRIRHYLAAPIVAGDSVLGTLNLGRVSESAGFDRAAAARATMVGRAIGARLAGLAAAETDGGAEAALGVEEAARLRALRALVRARPAVAGPALPSEVTAALWRAVAAGETAPLDVFDQGGRRYVVVDPRTGAPAGSFARLSPRELEIVVRVGAGESDKEIAFALGLTASTVSTHLSAARRKLGVSSRVALALAARRQSAS